MPFCPNCRDEYVVGVERCEGCGRALVAELPPLPALGDVRWRELPSFNNEAEAQMVRAALDTSGIRTMLKRDVFVSGFGSHGTVVFVPEESYDEAAGIRRSMVGD
ncbi:MAG: DUF2007 domain-containing protein [Sorangiineae bacterium]|nr:DUF2007 domain-containing protein [Polyangiaceae bacterium]MEB2322457.1 DUF2007 domain-containing protein [Sorangiineae bacterium]